MSVRSVQKTITNKRREKVKETFRDRKSLCLHVSGRSADQRGVSCFLPIQTLRTNKDDKGNLSALSHTSTHLCLSLSANHKARIHTCRSLQVESQLVFIRDSLKLIFGLYRHNNISSVTWDTKEMEHFLVCVYRQIEELDRCVSRRKF